MAFRHKCSERIKQADTKTGRLIEKPIRIQLGCADSGGQKWHNKGNNEEISWFEELNVLSAKQAGAGKKIKI
jgi:hypothetical protein